MSSEEAGHVSLMEVRPTSGKGTLGAWWSLRQVRARLDKTEHTTATRARGEAMSKLRICVPALEPCDRGEGSEAKGQDFKPDSRNSTVRHYRGASGNVTLVEMGTHLATERDGNPPPYRWRIRALSQPNRLAGRTQTTFRCCALRSVVVNGEGKGPIRFR